MREGGCGFQLEEPFLDKAEQKMMDLALSIQRLESSDSDNSSRRASISKASRQLDFTFIQDAVQELLRCRQVLKATYCYGYYLTGIVSKKQFEHMQVTTHSCCETCWFMCCCVSRGLWSR